MSLKTKILYILALVVGIYAAVDNGLYRVVASRYVNGLETEDGEQDAQLVLRAVDQQVSALETSAEIWASMQQTLEFVTQPDPSVRDGFIARELSARALRSADVDVLYLCDAEGRVLWSYVLDPESGEKIKLTRTLPAGQLHPTSGLMRLAPGLEAISGLMMSREQGPMLISSVPVRDEAGLGLELDSGSTHRVPIYGMVIMGRFLNHELLGEIGQAASCEVNFFTPQTSREEWGERESLLDGLTAGESTFDSLVGDDNKLHVFACLPDLVVPDPLFLEATLDRKITRLGQTVVDYALLSTIGSALLIFFALLRLLGRFVLGPLSTLTNKAVEIGRTDNTTIRVGMQRSDEIGQLATEFDSMLEKLADSRAQVVKTARKAGMSEIATGVLHNVGNVLNSVNVSANLVSKSAEGFALEDLDALIQVLTEQGDHLADFIAEDPRGKHLLPFLNEVSASLGRQKSSMLSELQSLTGGIDHIADLVRAQQTFAGAKGVIEFACLNEEIEQAIHICNQSISRRGGAELIREFAEIGTIKVDKHKLMEILVNLIQNAYQALAGTESGSKIITLRTLELESGQVRIEVQDNGMGIHADNLVNVFNHGFTTKADGHGFGLHVSANAATEMQASLKVRSGGIGHGATFYLDLPKRVAELQEAA